MAAILRVQDVEGRGPYRPGLSHRWSDPNGDPVMPWWLEIGESMVAAHQRCVAPYHWGCGFRSHDQLSRWFSGRELRRLDRLGFRLVTIVPDIIAAETPSQIVFGTIFPLTNVLRSIRLGTRAADVVAA